MAYREHRAPKVYPQTKFIQKSEISKLYFALGNRGICSVWTRVLSALPIEIPLNRDGVRLIYNVHKQENDRVMISNQYRYNQAYQYIVYVLSNNQAYINDINLSAREQEKLALEEVKKYREKS